MKAGLLPRLADHVPPIYVEATADQTEKRLIAGLQKHCRQLSGHQTLVEQMSSLRRGQGLPAGQKALIVLDQFEQWLHVHRQDEQPELVEALRQCDGHHVQCLVMVRDDFWLAISRFMHDLEIPLERRNSALVDFFDVPHALKVLTAFGCAYGRLDVGDLRMNDPQRAFVEQVVNGLAEEGKVVCVRLSLFAEMMKGKPWTPTTLKGVGGTKGVGVTFSLEETFSASTAPPVHRYHQQTARAVLQALLPESGTDIKGTRLVRGTAQGIGLLAASSGF